MHIPRSGTYRGHFPQSRLDRWFWNTSKRKDFLLWTDLRKARIDYSNIDVWRSTKTCLFLISHFRYYTCLWLNMTQCKSCKNCAEFPWRHIAWRMQIDFKNFTSHLWCWKNRHALGHWVCMLCVIFFQTADCDSNINSITFDVGVSRSTIKWQIETKTGGDT